MTDQTLPEHIVNFIAQALEAADIGQPEPPAHELTADELEAARLILAAITSAQDIDVDIPPLTEDPIAIRLGIAAEPPPVAIDATAFNAALQEIDTDQLLADLASYGHTADADWLSDLRDGAIEEISPVVLRALGALLDVSQGHLALNAIEPYPASKRGRLDRYLDGTGWATETDGDAVMIASVEHRLGLLVAHVPNPGALAGLNVRRVAWEFLTGLWTHTSACAVISPLDDWDAVIIDAIDCQPHQSAPSGILTYGPDHNVQPLRVALSTYEARYHVIWAPPQPLPQPALMDDLIHGDATSGIHGLLSLSARSHEPKRTAWTEVRDRIVQLDPNAWGSFIAVDETTDAEEIETMLETLLEQ